MAHNCLTSREARIWPDSIPSRCPVSSILKSFRFKAFFLLVTSFQLLLLLLLPTLTGRWSMLKTPEGDWTLIPSAPQNFTVERILPSTDGTFLALAGPKGVSIIELPRRWGPNGQYQNGKECIICR
uniref:Uncharacterized protein n=1 Tax=Anopheles epiroticus TaxID=199890 RepID=A0A182PJ32_9DIPT